jgi:hypothetical protein
MTLPFSLGAITLPDWMPWWLPLLLAIPALLYALLLLSVPFSVFGLRTRLEGIEDRLDEIQGEIRSLSLRLPAADDELAASAMRAPRPPIPPARGRVAPRSDGGNDDDERERRAEPHIEWPRS